LDKTGNLVGLTIQESKNEQETAASFGGIEIAMESGNSATREEAT